MSTTPPPSFEDLRKALTPRLTQMLAGSTGFASVSPLTKSGGERSDLAVLDGTAKLLVRGADGRPTAVVLVASPVAPQLVARGMQRAREAKMLLGPALGEVILTPLGEGEIFDRSYAVLPYCRPLTTTRLMWTFQRRRIRVAVLDWLRNATAATMQEPPPEKVEGSFGRPLRRILEDAELPEPLRNAAREAIARLEAGLWSPRHVLMHNDFWPGNLLIDDRNVTGRGDRPWPQRFVVIDWPGAAIEGYGLYDLLRFAPAMGLRGESLRREVIEHCNILQCTPAAARCHLIAALAYLAMHLEHFPKPAFVRTALACMDTLANLGPLDSGESSRTPLRAERTEAIA